MTTDIAETFAPNEPSDSTVELFTAPNKQLYDEIAKEESLTSRVLKVEAGGASGQSVSVGRKQPPINMDLINRLRIFNAHHARCIEAKKSSTVGLGFETPADKKRKRAKRAGLPEPDTTPEEERSKINTLLSPLTDNSWQDLIADVAEDFWTYGRGYIEVVRAAPKDDAPIVGLHHIPAREVFVEIEDYTYQRHYAIVCAEGAERRFARFGDLESFISRAGSGAALNFAMPDGGVGVSEVIEFRQPTSLSRWYGFPDWIAATAYIELNQCLIQHEYDFFNNAGVPEFMLFLLGQELAQKDKDKIKRAIRSTIGFGNAHKSLLINLANPEIKVQLEKLAMESKSDGSQFAGMSDSLALSIVSAHGVPPLLAGIQIPGKLGATNELVQAMQAFQSLVIAPAQQIFQETLINTLGDKEKSGGLGLEVGDFTLNTIIDKVDLQNLDTVARMRQSPQEAKAEGRDLSRGVKKEDEELDERLAKVFEAVLKKALTRAA